MEKPLSKSLLKKSRQDLKQGKYIFKITAFYPNIVTSREDLCQYYRISILSITPYQCFGVFPIFSFGNITMKGLNLSLVLVGLKFIEYWLKTLIISSNYPYIL